MTDAIACYKYTSEFYNRDYRRVWYSCINCWEYYTIITFKRQSVSTHIPTFRGQEGVNEASVQKVSATIGDAAPVLVGSVVMKILLHGVLMKVHVI